MASLEEISALAGRLARHEVAPDLCRDWDAWSPAERRECVVLAVYEMGRHLVLRGPAQRKALALLVSHLAPGQLAEYRRSSTVTVIGSAGGVYRLNPRCGSTERVERHGRRNFAKQSYCLHDEADEMPHAEPALAHLLLLRADEPAFLALANAYARGDDMWSGEYRRRMREARARREQEETDVEEH